jgi:hypothetical protein
MIKSWRRFLTDKLFFLDVFGMAVENRRHFFAVSPFLKMLQAWSG